MKDAEIRAKLMQGTDYAELPGHHVTINQIVAWNLTYFRKAAGLTQEELGELLGWSKTIVSAAERSWDSKRVRTFSAQDVAAIAKALTIPIAGLFLPPEDDGVNNRYLVHLPTESGLSSNCMTMHDLMLYVVPDFGEPPLSEDDGKEAEETDEEAADPEAFECYWNRYTLAIDGYLRAYRLAELLEYMDIQEEDSVIEHIARLRQQYDALREMLSDNDHLQAALSEELNKLRKGRPIRQPDRRTPEQKEWERQVKAVIRDLFGPGTNLSRGQIDQAAQEAIRRGAVPVPREKMFLHPDEPDPPDPEDDEQ